MLFISLLLAYNFYIANTLESFNFNGQNHYEVILERTEKYWINDKILSDLSTKTFKFNRTMTVFNIESVTKVEIKSWKVQAIVYKFSANDYKRTAIQATVDCCQVLKYNFFGMAKLLKQLGNVTDCPIKQGTYVLHNGILDSRRLPPNVPEGRAKLELTHFANGEKACIFNVYGEIRYTVKVKKN